MNRIMGNPTATPMKVPDWNQSDPKKADYIKNKPDLDIYEVKPEIVINADGVEFIEYITLRNNSVINYGTIWNALNVSLNLPNFGDMAALHFVSPETIPTNYTTFPSLVRFKGDSTQDEKFVAEPNMYYTMVFEKLGDRIIGYVSGVTL